MNVCKLDREYYYINEPIGFGSFSIIYKGYKYEDNSPVAIKLIIFVGFAGLAGYVQSFSTIAAFVVGCAGFYICFMR